MGELVNNTQLELSAEELRSLTDWPDSLIEDYLAISRQLIQVTTETQITIEQTSLTLSSVERVSSQVRGLAQQLSSLTNQVSNAQVDPKVRQHSKALGNQMELIAQNLADIASLRSGQLGLDKGLGDQMEAIAGNLSGIAVERSARRRLEGSLGAKVMARVMLRA
jgi:hypothetical protein